MGDASQAGLSAASLWPQRQRPSKRLDEMNQARFDQKGLRSSMVIFKRLQIFFAVLIVDLWSDVPWRSGRNKSTDTTSDNPVRLLVKLPTLGVAILFGSMRSWRLTCCWSRLLAFGFVNSRGIRDDRASGGGGGFPLRRRGCRVSDYLGRRSTLRIRWSRAGSRSRTRGDGPESRTLGSRFSRDGRSLLKRKAVGLQLPWEAG